MPSLYTILTDIHKKNHLLISGVVGGCGTNLEDLGVRAGEEEGEGEVGGL